MDEQQNTVPLNVYPFWQETFCSWCSTVRVLWPRPETWVLKCCKDYLWLFFIILWCTGFYLVKPSPKTVFKSGHFVSGVSTRCSRLSQFPRIIQWVMFFLYTSMYSCLCVCMCTHMHTYKYLHGKGVRFEVLTVVLPRIQLAWNVMLSETTCWTTQHTFQSFLV